VRTPSWPGVVRGLINGPGSDEIPEPPRPDRASLQRLPSPGKPARRRLLQIQPRRDTCCPWPSMCPCENARMDGLACPCGLGDDYESCCGRLHTGTSAPTAEPLMRSRYSAFAVADAGHLLRTWHPSVRSRTLSLDPALRWTRVAVLETRDCGLRRHRHGAVPSHIRPAGAAWRPRGDQQVRPARRTLDLPRLH
jgi:SEC-C motif domain protein